LNDGGQYVEIAGKYFLKSCKLKTRGGKPWQTKYLSMVKVHDRIQKKLVKLLPARVGWWNIMMYGMTVTRWRPC
jgi:hypothetical protein